MRGQATIEAMLIIAAIIPVATAYGYMSLQSSEPVNLVSGVETGVSSEIHNLELSHGLIIDLEDVTRFGDNIIVNLNLKGGEIKDSDNDVAYIEKKILEEALESGAKSVGGISEDNEIYIRPGTSSGIKVEINDERGI